MAAALEAAAASSDVGVQCHTTVAGGSNPDEANDDGCGEVGEVRRFAEAGLEVPGATWGKPPETSRSSWQQGTVARGIRFDHWRNSSIRRSHDVNEVMRGKPSADPNKLPRGTYSTEHTGVL